MVVAGIALTGYAQDNPEASDAVDTVADATDSTTVSAEGHKNPQTPAPKAPTLTAASKNKDLPVS